MRFLLFQNGISWKLRARTISVAVKKRSFRNITNWERNKRNKKAQDQIVLGLAFCVSNRLALDISTGQA